MSVCEDSTVAVLPVQVSFPKCSLLSRYQTRRSYTKGGTFQPHWDSRYKWGEVSRLHILVYVYFLLSEPLAPFPFFGRNQTVVGVSLGAAQRSISSSLFLQTRAPTRASPRRRGVLKSPRRGAASISCQEMPRSENALLRRPSRAPMGMR